METYRLSHLDALEAESIHIMREVAAEFERPVLLFSGGKDSIVMLQLAEKAFRPARLPFPVMHIDTGHNFPEVIKFRDELIEKKGERLIVRKVEDLIASGHVQDAIGSDPSRNSQQIPTLLAAIDEFQFDAAFGGARRDEEKARAKERILSFRDDFGQWDPKSQRPELWNIYNGRIESGQHIRAFPISNWTELDVWQYIKRENLEIPSIYYTHKRQVFERNNQWLSVCDWLQPRENEEVVTADVRFRTVGDMVCTGGVLSRATTIDEIVAEIAAARITERGARADDRKSEAAMEDRKKQGYF